MEEILLAFWIWTKSHKLKTFRVLVFTLQQMFGDNAVFFLPKVFSVQGRLRQFFFVNMLVLIF